MLNKKGFTILEIVTIMGVFLAVSVIVMPFFISQMQGARAESYASQIASNLFLYQQNAYTGKNGSDFGVYFESDRYVLFEGSTYSGSNIILDILLPSNINISLVNLDDNSDEIVFSSGSILPTSSGAITISDNNEDYLVKINEEGFINYEYFDE